MARYFFILFIVCFPLALFSQTEEATTESGKKVILYADGTWKLKTEEVKTTKTVVKTKDKKEDKVKPETLPVNLEAGCADLFETVKDKNNTVIIRTKNFLIITGPEEKSELDISMQKGAKGIISISFRTGTGNECIGEGNKVSIVFTDGRKLDLSNEGPANCRGESVCYFSGPYGKKKQLQELKDKKIRSIRIWTQQSSLSKELSGESQDEFIRLLSCLISA